MSVKETASNEVNKSAIGANLVAAALAVCLASYLALQGAGVKAFLTFTDKSSWAWEITAMGFMMKIAMDNKEKVAGFYWVKALVTTAIAAFGGGFLAPIAVAHTPVPLMEETYFWMVVTAWYITHHVPFLSDALTAVMRAPLGQKLFIVLFGIFKTNQIVGGLELGAKAVAAETLVPGSRYFKTAVAAPLFTGFLSGCGGAFLPFTNGLAPIEDACVWNVSASFLAPLTYFIATRACSCDPLLAKLAICVCRILGDLFPAPRDAVLGLTVSLFYKVTNLHPVAAPGKKVD